MNRFLASIFLTLIPAVGIAATLHVPTEYPTIKSAIKASVSGDEVIVVPGTYSESGIEVQHALVIRSAIAGERVVIDGQEQHEPVLFIVSWEANASIALQDIAVVNGSYGIILNSVYVQSVTMDRCKMSSNSWAGLIFMGAYNSTLEMRDCEASYNAGGGIVVEPGREMSVQNCEISENTETGVFVVGSTFSCRDSRIANNHTPQFGAGALLISSTVQMSNVEFSGNSAAQAGGGISMRGADGTYYLDGCSFVDCSAPVAAQAYIHANAGYVINATFNCCEIDTSQFGGPEWESGAVAITNDGCPVPVRALDWGSVKALFR